MDVLPTHLNRDSFGDSFKGLVALEIIIDLPFGFPINNIISQMQWEAPSKPLAVDDPLLLPEQEVHAEIGINWVLDQDTPSHPEEKYVRILAESLLWEERLGKTTIRTTEGLTTCMEPHRGWTIARSSWIFL